MCHVPSRIDGFLSLGQYSRRRVGVRRGHRVERRVRVGTHAGDLTHRRFGVLRAGRIHQSASGVLHLDERIGVGISLGGDVGCFGPRQARCRRGFHRLGRVIIAAARRDHHQGGQQHADPFDRITGYFHAVRCGARLAEFAARSARRRSSSPAYRSHPRSRLSMCPPTRDNSASLDANRDV
jgi:hypothetical protein